MLVRVLVATLFLAVLWKLFRFAMGLRFAKVQREEERRAEEAAGRRVVAEVPLPDDVQLVLEDESAFHFRGLRLDKQAILGARLLLNGGVVDACVGAGGRLPEPAAAEEFDGRERWEVAVYLKTGSLQAIPCGSLREGVSRDVARQVFAAVRSSLAPGALTASRG